MAVKPPTPKWQTVTLFFCGLSVFLFEVGLNAVTGQAVNYSLIGGAMGMMMGGPVLSRSSRRSQRDNDDADAQ